MESSDNYVNSYITVSSNLGNYFDRILDKANKSKDPESFNARHQLRLLKKALELQRQGNIVMLGPNELALFRTAIVISDYGKTKAGKKLLTVNDREGKSNKLLDYLKELSLLNPDLKNTEIRDSFKKVPALQAYFHSLPGFIFIKELEENRVESQLIQELKEIVLFHDGPQKGFWDKFTQETNNKLKEKNIKIHHNSKFCDGKGNLQYPLPNGELANVHCAIDREDSAIEGLPKIAFEIGNYAGGINSLKDELLKSTQDGALAQLKMLKSKLKGVADNEKEPFKSLIDDIIIRISRFKKYLQQKVEGKSRLSYSNDNGKQKISFKHFDGSTEILEEDEEGNFSNKIELHKAQSKKDFMQKNAAGFLSRVINGFKDSELSTAI